ncbi:MAG: CinA family protein [Gammaproteobacteria bacterium]|jgi:nicotinamide-nucleotide amidase
MSAPAALTTLVAALTARRQWLAVAESCTGGLIAKICTDLPGSSAWFERGLVTYSNRAKQELLGVPAELIAGHGAVSEAVARAMAEGLLQRAPVDWTLAVTGIAGPDGGSADKPVGTVWLACAGREGGVLARPYRFGGDREAVREQSAAAAFELLRERVSMG